MEGKIIIDTMYLSVRYPKKDVFDNWYRYAEGVDHRKLKDGIAVGDFVVRSGSSGYKVSVWQHDARVYLTPEVDEIRGEGKGMGIWVQLGPKFLIHHGAALLTGVKDLLQDIGIIGDYETRITRIDIAIDLFDVSMKDQDLNLWRYGWVGRSKVSAFHFNSRTGDLETINIGSRNSPIYLRIYDKIAQAIKDGDIAYWFDVWKVNKENVTRVEWEVKPRQGNFQKDLMDFSLFTGFSIIELLNYLLDWGRFCIPDQSDTNRNRWQDTAFWEGIREVAAQWADGVDWPISRYGKEFKPITEGYIKHLSGTIAGGMARFGKDKPSLADMFEGLEKYGENHQAIQERAKDKYLKYQNL